MSFHHNAFPRCHDRPALTCCSATASRRIAVSAISALIANLFAAGFTLPVAAEPAEAAAREAVPAPKSAITAEAEYRKAADAVIDPLLKVSIEEADLSRVKQAFAAVGSGNIKLARQTAAEIANPTAKKLVDWYALTRGFGGPAEYRDFLAANPTWPQRWLLQQRLEEALFTGGGSATEIASYFRSAEPETATGGAALASAWLALGEKEKARALAAKVWREDNLPVSLETGFVERFGSLLTAADHRWRLDRYLMGDRRWKAGRAERAAYVRRLIPLLPEADRKKAEARLAVYLRSSAGDKLMAALPQEKATDWGLVFQRIQMLRRKGNNDAAIRLMLSAPTETDKIVSPDDWWDERRALAYEALEKGDTKVAYALVKNAGPLTVNPLKQQQFMAGWIAKRHLGDLAAAERHFRAMREAADGPLSRSKADYWLGRTHEEKGTSEASTYYKRAANEYDTFHGLLARYRLEGSAKPIRIAPPALPSDDEIAAFRGLDSLLAPVIAKRAGLGGEITRPFLANSRTARDSEAWSGLVAHLADALGDTQMSLRIAKSAVGSGHNLLIYAYPLGAFPSYTPLRKPPEPAFLLAIARQETEFNTQIVSGAGARGLLQVMPITARHVCTDYKIKCDIPRLLTDKVYNTMIGSAYIADRMGEFDGNYVLTLAGYNAGPGRARQWIREFGDPRTGKIDPIDWIERIPFEETREYVGKVLSNIQIYRARIGDQPALRLGSDLGLDGRSAVAKN